MGLTAAHEGGSEDLFVWFKERLAACKPKEYKIGAFEENSLVIEYLEHLKKSIEMRESTLHEQILFFENNRESLEQRKRLPSIFLWSLTLELVTLEKTGALKCITSDELMAEARLFGETSVALNAADCSTLA